MLVADRFVLLHMPKTAGTSLATVLPELLPGLRRIRVPGTLPHPGWGDIPPEAAGLPVLAFVRNPWDWYVSWFHFMQTHRPGNAIWRTTFGDGRYDFATTVRNACTGVVAHHRPPVMALVQNGTDFYSAVFRTLVGEGLESERLTLGRFEALEDDLERFLVSSGVEVPEDFRRRIGAAPRRQVSEHRPYATYYDDALRDLVGDRCRWFVDRFGYRFA